MPQRAERTQRKVGKDLQRKLLLAKIHGATVTGAELQYEGSIAVDSDLLKAAGILPSESVHVWNVSNGSRFETYAITSPAGSGQIVVNGAAARSVQPGDRIIIAAFVWVTPEEAAKHNPTIVIVDSANHIVRKR
jgi:aspartate 1-decarboxylase